jgi:DNA-binding IclR family transcriptional regulator
MEVARATALPLAPTYPQLRTCAHEGWVQGLEGGSYVLGHRIDAVRAQGTAARGIAHARPALEWLRDALGGAVYLARYVDGEVVVSEIVDSARAPRIDLWVGMHDAAHATALGKCILGQLPALEREDYLARHPLHDLTPRTVVDRRRLELPATSEVAVDDGEYAIGVCCLAATVTAGRDTGAVGVVTAPRDIGRPTTRETLLLGAGRVSRALALGAATI